MAMTLNMGIRVKPSGQAGGAGGRESMKKRHDYVPSEAILAHFPDNSGNTVNGVDLHLKLTQDLHLILTHPERQIMA